MARYLTLIGGPVPQPRTKCDVPFTADVLRFGGGVYIKTGEWSPTEMIYMAAGYCDHEWSDWYLVHRSSGISELYRTCLKCPQQNWEPFQLPA